MCEQKTMTDDEMALAITNAWRKEEGSSPIPRSQWSTGGWKCAHAALAKARELLCPPFEARISELEEQLRIARELEGQLGEDRERASTTITRAEILEMGRIIALASGWVGPDYVPGWHSWFCNAARNIRDYLTKAQGRAVQPAAPQPEVCGLTPVKALGVALSIADATAELRAENERLKKRNAGFDGDTIRRLNADVKRLETALASERKANAERKAEIAELQEDLAVVNSSLAGRTEQTKALSDELERLREEEVPEPGALYLTNELKAARGRVDTLEKERAELLEKLAPLSRLDEVAALKDNWDTYGSPAPTSAAIATARKILQATAIPISGGGVQLDWDDCDIEIGPNGRIIAEPLTVEPLSNAEIRGIRDEWVDMDPLATEADEHRQLARMAAEAQRAKVKQAKPITEAEFGKLFADWWRSSQATADQLWRMLRERFAERVIPWPMKI